MSGQGKSVKIIAFFVSLCMAFCLSPLLLRADAQTQTDAEAYSQYDSRWGSWVYGEGTIAGTGCGILSTVNAFNYLNKIDDIGAAIDEVATWAHDINGFNGTWDLSGGTDRTVVYPRLEAKFGQKYNITVPQSNVWKNIYSDDLKNHLTEYGNVAIAHVKYGHFIVLAEYDRANDLFLVLDSAPTVSGNTKNGVAWLPPEQLNSVGNDRMNVDWYCLISSTATAVPELKDGELYLTDGLDKDGFWGELGTSVSVTKLDSKSGVLISNNDRCKGNAASVGSMAMFKYSGLSFASAQDFNTVTAEIWCSEDYCSLSQGKDDYFQINFITDISSQDGYNAVIPASQIKKGWNTVSIKRNDIAKAVDSADWTDIRRMRFTWFNLSQSDGIDFALGAVKFTCSPIVPEEQDDSLIILDGTTLAGFTSSGGTELSVSKREEEKCQNGYSVDMSNAGCNGEGRMVLNLDQSFDATRYEKFSLTLACSVPYVFSDRKKDTLDIILSSGESEGGYKATLKYYDIYGDWQNINIDLKKFTSSDKTVDLKKIDRVSFVWKNVSGDQPADFYFSSVKLTGKKALTLLFGDADRSGEITANDALLTLQQSIGAVDFEKDILNILDVDADGEVGANDALLILQKSVGMIDSFPCQKA